MFKKGRFVVVAEQNWYLDVEKANGKCIFVLSFDDEDGYFAWQY